MKCLDAGGDVAFVRHDTVPTNRYLQQDVSKRQEPNIIPALTIVAVCSLCLDTLKASNANNMDPDQNAPLGTV